MIGGELNHLLMIHIFEEKLGGINTKLTINKLIKGRYPELLPMGRINCEH